MAKRILIKLTASEIGDMLARRFKAQVMEGIVTRPLCIIGHAGVGKTEVVRQVATHKLSNDVEFMDWAEENALKFYPTRSLKEARELVREHKVRAITTNLQFCEPPDFLGLPWVGGTPGAEVTKHARPELLPSEGLVIWFLDEANRCSRDNRSGLLTVIQDRNVNGHKLGYGAMIVIAQNPSEADGVAYEVAEFDAALQDRLSPIDFKGDAKETIKYLEDKYGDEDPIVRWITSHPENIDFTGKTRTSPRGLEFCIKALRAEGGVGSSTAFNTMATEIGQEGATALNKFLSSVENLSAEEVVDRWTAKTLKKIHNAEEKGRQDLLNSLNDGIINLLRQRVSKMRVKVDQQTGKVTGGDKVKFRGMMDNIIKYMEGSAADQRAAFFLAAGDSLQEGGVFELATDYMIKKSSVIKSFLVGLNEHDIEVMQNQAEKTEDSSKKVSKKKK
jgi:MoxR-like ATPase